MIKNQKNFRAYKNSGYGMVELLFYLSLFALLSLAVINSMITMTTAFRETTVQSDHLGGANIMERMAREIRQAYAIGSISAADLNLNSTDAGGANKTVQFILAGTNVEFRENSVLLGNLNPGNLSVSALSFAEIITAKGKAVKIFMTIRSNNDALSRTTDFYNTVVLRGDYDE